MILMIATTTNTLRRKSSYYFEKTGDLGTGRLGDWGKKY